MCFLSLYPIVYDIFPLTNGTAGWQIIVGTAFVVAGLTARTGDPFTAVADKV